MRSPGIEPVRNSFARRRRSRWSLALAASFCAFLLAGCPRPPAGSEIPFLPGLEGRSPSAALVAVRAVNQSGYLGEVQIQFFIGDVVVHETQGFLSQPPAGQTSLDGPGAWQIVAGPDEADRVTVQAALRDASGETVWSDERTFLIEKDFVDGDLLEYFLNYTPPPPQPLPQNEPPVANAGQDQVVDEGRPVALDGSGSNDPDGDPLTYLWEQISGPPVILQRADKAVCGFVAPQVSQDTTLGFRLTVSDGEDSASDEVTVLVRQVNQPPAVDAYGARVDEGQLVTLDGDSSSDPDGDPLTYLWEQVSGPPVTLQDADQAICTFVAPQVDQDTTMVFRLTVSDGEYSDSEEVTVLVRDVNQPPVVDAGPDILAFDTGESPWPPQRVVLAAKASDPDGDPVTLRWQQVGGSAVNLEPVLAIGKDAATAAAGNGVYPDPLEANPVKFLAAILCECPEETFIFEVTAEDGKGGVASDQVSVTVRLLGDFDGDGDFDSDDCYILTYLAYDTCEGEPGWNPWCDLNHDGCIDDLDVEMFDCYSVFYGNQ